MIIILTTKKEKNCLAPDIKRHQIICELGEEVKEICLDKNPKESLIAQMESLKENGFLEDTVFIIETKNRELIDIVERYTKLHTGESMKAIKFDDDKFKLKGFLMGFSVPTPKGFLCNKNVDIENLVYPCFVKPADNEDSIGINENSLCRCENDVIKALQIFDTNDRLLIEEYLNGAEYTVSVFKKGKDSFLVLPARIEIPQNRNGERFLDYDLKLSDRCKLKADFSEEKRTELCRLAVKTFQLIGAEKYARIDMRDNSNGIAHVLEVNLYAGLGANGYMADCFRANNLSYKRMLEEVLLTSERGFFYA